MPQAVALAYAWVVANAAAIALVISLAASAYMTISARRNLGAGQQEKKQILRSASSPLNVIYGKNRSAGTMVFAEEAYLKALDQYGQEYVTDEEVLFLVVTHAGHPIYKVDNYKLNDDNYSQFGPGDVLIQTYKDGATEADPMLLSTSPSWHEDMIGRDFAWYVARLKFDQNRFPSGVPNINAEKWGWEVYDPRTEAVSWSDNPSLCLLHYLKHYVGYSDDELIIDLFTRTANVCDELISLPESFGQERRYVMGAEFSIDEEPASVMDKMLAAFGGEWVKVGGRLGVVAAVYYGPASIEITEDDLVDSVELQPEVERQDTFNTVRGKFNDPMQDYIDTDYPQVSVAEYVAEDGEEITSDLNLEFVQSPWQCQRLAHIAIQRNRYGMQIKLPCNLRGFKATPGTVITLRLPGIGLDGAEFRVLDWEFSLDNGVVLVARRELASMYNDAVGEPLDVPPLINSNNDIAAPTDLRFETDVNNDTVSGSLHWNNSAMQLAHTVVKISLGNVVTQTIQVPSPGEAVAIVGLAAGTYQINVFCVSVAGRYSPETTLNITLSNPTAPSHADVDVSSEGLTIMPHIGDDSQLSINTIFEFYFNVSNDLASAQRLGQGKMLTKQGLAPNTDYWFWIYTITPLGRSPSPLGIIAKTGLVSGDILEHIDNQVESKVADATAELLRDMGSLTDIRGIAEDLDAQILAEMLSQGLSQIEAEEQGRRLARVRQSVIELSDDQQSLAQEVLTIYAKFDENSALVQQRDRAAVGYAIKPDGQIGDATTPAEADELGETWIVGRALADSVKLVGIITEDGKSLTVQQYFSALQGSTGELKARAFLGIDSNGRTSGIGITSDDDGETIFQAINFIGDAISISSPDDPTKSLMYYDTEKQQLVVRGRMILGDGFEIDGESAIRAQDGGRWETRYKLDANSPATPTGRTPIGWGTAMPNPASSSQLIWATTAFINADDTLSISWSIPGRISGFKGDSGPQGVPGQNGSTTYTWIKYADSATGGGLSNDPAGKTYIGFAYNKATATESNTAGDYTWSLIQGAQGNQGVPGAKGADGVTTYTWIKYSDNADGTGLYDTPTANTKYIGIAVNKTVQAESALKADYVWSQFRGENGLDGSWVDYRFRRYPSQPPQPTGITPGLWPDAPPDGTDPLWMVKMKKQFSDQPVDGEVWSIAIRIDGQSGNDGASIEVQWSVNGSTAWHDSYVQGDMWMRQRQTGGAWGAAIRAVGEKGEKGDAGPAGVSGYSGAGFHRLVNSTGVWPGDGAANGLFYNAYGRYPVIDDVLTFYSSTAVTSTTKRCTAAGNGSNATWAAAALLVHGDMIGLGTIAGDRFVAGSEISAPFIRGGHIEIGGANGTFAVDVNGGVLIKSSGTNARMEIINDRLQVYDDTGALSVRIGRL
jgi:hypothetical protein